MDEKEFIQQDRRGIKMDEKEFGQEDSKVKVQEEGGLREALREQSTTLELDAPAYAIRVKKERKKKKARGLRMVIAIPAVLLVFLGGMIVEYRRILKDLKVNKQYFLMDDAVLEDIKERAGKDATAAFYENIKEYGQETQVNVKFMRKMFPDNIVLKSGGEFLYLPIDESIEKNNYDSSCFVKKDEFMEYQDEQGKVVSKKGIDVSKFQGEIDWKLVKEDGVEFAILRAGYRGYGSGKIVIDEMYLKNLEGTKEENIDIGVYFYSQAISKEEAVEEAKMVIDSLKGYQLTYPVVLDTELPSGEGARTANLTKEERTEYILAFCETIKEAGYTPMIYSNLNWFMLNTDYKALSEYDIWLANYDNVPYFPYDFKMWQYSEKGKVNGISGDVDLNICLKDYSQKDK